MKEATFQHLDPTSTFIYQHQTVMYGFETEEFCFRCRVRRGYLVGQRDALPDNFMWAIGQHIDTMRDFVINLMPLCLVTPRHESH